MSQNKQSLRSAEYMDALHMFGDTPTLGIIYFLSDGDKRFNELERLTCVNPVTLTDRLKRMTEKHIVKRTQPESDKQAVIYSLDALGEKAVPIVRQIEKFIKEVTK